MSYFQKTNSVMYDDKSDEEGIPLQPNPKWKYIMGDNYYGLVVLKEM